MDVISKKFGRILQKTVGTTLVLALLLSLCPWVYAVEVEEDPPAGEQAEEEWEEVPETTPEELPPLEEEPEEEPVVLSDTIVAYPVTGGNIYFDMSTGTITDCDTSVTEAVIPAVINDVEVTCIGWYAFYECSSLTSVMIPDSVTSIEFEAFYDCSSLTSITIPDSVTSIGWDAFSLCSSLTSITIPDSVTSIGWDAFSHCSSLTSITIPDSVTSIGVGVFSYCSSLTSITIPNSVTSIEYEAFYDCSSLTSITIPNSVTSIGGYAFYNCSSLTSITIPNSVTGIGDYAFYNCSSLTSITIPDSVISIGGYAFSLCSSLTSITIPDSVTSIGDSSFSYCSSLTSITIPNSVTSIGGHAFSDCSSLTSVTMSDSITSIADNLFSGCTSLTSITIPNSVTSIGKAAFIGCSGLKQINIPDSVISIGMQAFHNCGNLTSVTIGDGVTSIGVEAFSACDRLTSVTIPNNITRIERRVFWGCDELTRITIPDSVVTIEADAFGFCPNLTSVTIGNGVVSIGENAFSSNNLASVYFRGDAPSVFPAGGGESSFSSGFCNTILYYSTSKSGWTTPTWNGYDTVPVIGEGDPGETHTGSYYAKQPNYHLRFTDNAGSPLSDVSVEIGGQSLSSGASSEVTFAYSGSDSVHITKSGYHDAYLPASVLGNYSSIMLYPDTYSAPFVQAAYGSRDGGTTYCDLLNSGMSFHAGSLTEKTGFYIDVNWGDHGAGKIYLSQTLTPEDGVELRQGLNDAENISVHLKSSGGLYLIMIAADGLVSSQSLRATILSEDTDFSIDFGDSIDIPEPDDNFLSKFKMKFDLPKKIKASLSVEPDGSVLATLGVKVSEEKDVGPAVKTIKDALYYADNYPKDWDSFVGALKGSIIPQSSSFGITLDSKVIGYLEGKLVHEADGSLGILFTEGKIAASFKGGAEQTWQIYAFGAPFYVGGAIETSLEFGVPIWSNEKVTEIFLDPLETEAEFTLKARGGLGWDSIASAGIYGKAKLTGEFTIPLSKDTLKLYANGTIGAEAKFFCFEADVEIFKSSNLYLYGSPDDTPGAGGRMMLSAASLDWQPQSRDYLYSPSLFDVGDDQTQAGVSTVVSGVYPYADVQMAALEDGTQVVVWTADPGETARPAANNRTMLYYCYYNGAAWSTPAPVETENDGTGDFNPLLKVLDGKAYLLWQDASRPLTAADDVAATAALMDISVAVFDPNTGAFVSLGTVGTGGYDGAVSAAMVDGALSVVWASNSGENPLAADGPVGALHRAVWDGFAWTVEMLAQDLGAIDQTAADGSQIWFSADTDYDADTVADREIFLFNGDLLQLTRNDVADTKPTCLDGKVLWYSGGAITAEDGKVIPLAEDTDQYDYVRSKNGLEAVVYAVTDTSRISALYASFNDGTGWGEPILLNSSGGNIGGFSAQFLADGTLSVITSERIAEPTTEEYDVPKLSSTAQLRAYSVTPTCDLAVENVTYLAQSLTDGGTLDVQMELKNMGMTAVNLTEITVRDGTRVLAEQMVFTDLLSGKSTAVTLGVPLTDGVPESLSIAISPVGYSDANTINNAAQLVLRLSDISLEGGTAWSDGSGTTASVLVVNRGQQEWDNVTLSLYGEDGSLVSSETAPTLSPGNSEFVTFYLDDPLENNSVLTVEASGVGEENIMGNNRCAILVSAQQEARLTFAAGHMITDSGIAVVTTVRNATVSQQEYMLCCASYGANGQLLKIVLQESLVIRSGEESIHQLVLPKDESAVSLKVFILDSAYGALTGCIKMDLL